MIMLTLLISSGQSTCSFCLGFFPLVASFCIPFIPVSNYTFLVMYNFLCYFPPLFVSYEKWCKKSIFPDISSYSFLHKVSFSNSMIYCLIFWTVQKYYYYYYYTVHVVITCNCWRRELYNTLYYLYMYLYQSTYHPQ